MNRRESMTKKGALDMKEGVNVSGIGAQEAAKLETLFKLLSNGEDEIGLTELADLMPRLGCFHTEEELKTLFESVDIDGSGLINFMEFLQFMARYRESSQLALLEGGAECFRHLTAASKMKNVIRADDPLNWAGDILILASIIFYIVVALYEDARATDMGAVPNALKIFFAIVMVLDVLRGMFTSQEPKDTGCLPSDDRSAVRLRYLKSYRFVIDVIAALPIDMVLWVAGEETGMRVAQNVRMAKFFAFWTLFRLTPRDILSPTYARFYFVYVPMLKLAFWAVITTHCLAVIWIMLQEDAASDDAWAYLDSLYFVVYTLTTTGYGDIDVTTESQKIFSVFLFCCATLVTGVVVGKIVQVSQQADLKSDARTRMLETLAALNHLTIPNDFKEEVLAFQLHRLKHSNSLFNDAINGLPVCMQDRMALYARMKIVREVPIFAEVTEVCVAKLAQSLVNVFVAPEEYIVIAGEEGEEMFFLFHGMCCVSLPDGRVVATIKRGGVFGEVALLQQTRRAASIKSLTYCQLFRLDKVDFEAITVQFPKVFESIVAQSVTLRSIKERKASEKSASADAAENGDVPVIKIIGASVTVTSPHANPDSGEKDILASSVARPLGKEGTANFSPSMVGGRDNVPPVAHLPPPSNLLDVNDNYSEIYTKLGHIEEYLEAKCLEKNITIGPVQGSSSPTVPPPPIALRPVPSMKSVKGGRERGATVRRVSLTGERRKSSHGSQGRRDSRSSGGGRPRARGGSREVLKQRAAGEVSRERSSTCVVRRPAPFAHDSDSPPTKSLTDRRDPDPKRPSRERAYLLRQASSARSRPSAASASLVSDPSSSTSNDSLEGLAAGVPSAVRVAVRSRAPEG